MGCGKTLGFVAPAFVVPALLLVACASDDAVDDAGAGAFAGEGAIDGAAPIECDVTAPIQCPEPSPTYADVEPIFEQRCVGCHYGMPGGPWPLTGYGHVADWRDEIRGQVLACTMPPPDAGVPMTVEEREAILTWILCGLPQ